jgi:hypothetical protein
MDRSFNIDIKLNAESKAKELKENFGNLSQNVVFYLMNENSHIDASTQNGCDKAFERLEYWAIVYSELKKILK